MTIYYVDFENGNDANAGTSFATRWKTITNGATAARTAPGDEIRIMASPDPVDTGTNATWTQQTVGPRPQVNISTASNTTPIRITTSTAHGRTTGDTVYITGVATNLRANGTWTVTVINSTQLDLYNADGTPSIPTAAGTGGTIATVSGNVVKLASPLTQNIALCGNRSTKGNWTASANVTQTENTTIFKEGSSSESISITATFTTGKAAYYTLPSTLDLSAYQQVCFWVQQTAGTIGAEGSVYLALCSDTTGNTVVHTCNIPAMVAAGYWYPVVINFGTALNSNINSVALYVATDNGAQTFLLDNIFASKAPSSSDALNLASLISKNTAGETWFAMMSVNANRIVLAGSGAQQISDTFGSQVRGYNGTTATQTLYRRETVANVAQSTLNESGTAGSLITYSGGWDRTGMSTQTGETWLDGKITYHTGLYGNVSYISVAKINPVRYHQGFDAVNGSVTAYSPKYVSDISIVSCNSGFHLTGSYWIVSNMTTNACGSSSQYGGLTLFSTTMVGNVFTNIDIRNSGYGIYSTTSAGALYGRNLTMNGITLRNTYSASTLSDDSTYTDLNAINCYLGFNLGNNCSIFGGAATGTANQVLFNPAGYAKTAYIYDYTNSTAGTFWGNMTYSAGQVCFSNRQANTDNNHYIYMDEGTINFQTAITDSPAIGSWKMTTGSGTSEYNPLRLKLATVVCNAGSTVTVTARMRRSSTSLIVSLVAQGGKLPGVGTMSSSMTAGANSWETVTITFAPTSAGGVDIYADVSNVSSASAYVCNMTVTQ